MDGLQGAAISNLLILVGYKDGKEAYLDAVKPLIQALTTQLQIPVQTAFPPHVPMMADGKAPENSMVPKRPMHHRRNFTGKQKGRDSFNPVSLPLP